MYPVSENFKNDIEVYYKRLRCANQEDLTVYGDFNTQAGLLFNVQFIKCHDRPDCKSKKEITAFLRNKFIVVLANQIRFNPARMGESSFVAESVTYWEEINTQQ